MPLLREPHWLPTEHRVTFKPVVIKDQESVFYAITLIYIRFQPLSIAKTSIFHQQPRFSSKREVDVDCLMFRSITIF